MWARATCHVGCAACQVLNAMCELIRTAVTVDARDIAELITQLGYPTTASAMSIRLGAIQRDPSYRTVVAVAASAVVGVAGARLGRYYEKDGIYCQLVVLAVSPSARKRGIGRQLITEVENWSANKGAREVVVTSGLHRADAHAFYQRCGYRQTGLRFVKKSDSPI